MPLHTFFLLNYQFHFHRQSRGVQVLFFVQMFFEKCTTNLYFESGEAGVKTTIVHLKHLLV